MKVRRCPLHETLLERSCIDWWMRKERVWPFNGSWCVLSWTAYIQDLTSTISVILWSQYVTIIGNNATVTGIARNIDRFPEPTSVLTRIQMRLTCCRERLDMSLQKCTTLLFMASYTTFYFMRDMICWYMLAYVGISSLMASTRHERHLCVWYCLILFDCNVHQFST